MNIAVTSLNIASLKQVNLDSFRKVKDPGSFEREVAKMDAIEKMHSDVKMVAHGDILVGNRKVATVYSSGGVAVLDDRYASAVAKLRWDGMSADQVAQLVSKEIGGQVVKS